MGEARVADTAAANTEAEAERQGERVDFNLGYRATNYPPSQTAANWRFLTAALDIEPERIVAARQVHGSVVLPVTAADGGAGIRLQAWADQREWQDDEGPRKPPVAEADGLCTTESRVWLMNVYADCTPLLFYDPVNRAVAVAHAGWRGTVAQIGAEVVRVMAAQFGSRPDNLLAGIGPAAGPCCYQVAEEVINAVQTAFPHHPELLNFTNQPRGHAIFDLWAANRTVLQEAGVLPDNIETAALCTIMRHDLFFSARADGEAHAGRRFAAIIGLELGMPYQIMINNPAMFIHSRLVRVKERIAEACLRVGRPPAGVHICAVSKTQPLAMVQAAYNVGLYTFGENYVQEAVAKFAELPDANLHLIGHLQTNKVKQALTRFNLIETLDSPHLATAIEKEAAKLQRIVPVYIEVNVAAEASKSGISPAQATELAGYVAANTPHLRIEGLMTVAPAAAASDELHHIFSQLRELGEDLRRQLDPKLHPCWELSMGMSDDFEIAIEEGATIVRLGRILFGERPAQPINS